VYGAHRGDRELVLANELRFDDLVEGDGPIEIGGQPSRVAVAGGGTRKSVATASCALRAEIRARGRDDRQRPTDHQRLARLFMHQVVAAMVAASHRQRIPVQIRRSGWALDNDEMPAGARYVLDLELKERIFDEPWAEVATYPQATDYSAVAVIDGTEVPAFP